MASEFSIYPGLFLHPPLANFVSFPQSIATEVALVRDFILCVAIGPLYCFFYLQSGILNHQPCRSFRSILNPVLHRRSRLVSHVMPKASFSNLTTRHWSNTQYIVLRLVINSTCSLQLQEAQTSTSSQTRPRGKFTVHSELMKTPRQDQNRRRH